MIKKQHEPSLQSRRTLLEAIESATVALNKSPSVDDQECLQAEIEALAKAGEIDLEHLDKEWSKMIQKEIGGVK